MTQASSPDPRRWWACGREEPLVPLAIFRAPNPAGGNIVMALV